MKLKRVGKQNYRVGTTEYWISFFPDEKCWEICMSQPFPNGEMCLVPIDSSYTRKKDAVEAFKKYVLNQRMEEL